MKVPSIGIKLYAGFRKASCGEEFFVEFKMLPFRVEFEYTFIFFNPVVITVWKELEFAGLVLDCWIAISSYIVG